MATIPVFVFLGNSNMDGYASLGDVANADFVRWTGQSKPSTYPLDVTVPGVKMWTPKHPYGQYTDYTVVSTTATTVTFTAATLAATNVDQWIYVREATSGQGQLRKITAVNGSFDEATVAAWTTEPPAGSIIELWTDSGTINTVTSQSVFTKTAVTPNLGSHAGKFVMIISGNSAGFPQRIASNTTTQITMENPTVVSSLLPIAVGDGFRVLSGTGSVDGLSTLTKANGAIRDLRFYQDNNLAPSGAFDYPNFTSFPWYSPNTYKYYNRINCVPEALWQLRQQFTEPVHAVHVGIGSTTISPNYVADYASTIGFSWVYDIEHQDFHPSSVNGCYDVVTTCIANLAEALTDQGDEIDIKGFFAVLAENDTSNEQRANAAKANMLLIRDSLRTFVADGGYSKTNADQIPWVMSDAGSSSWTYRSTVNSSLLGIANDDEASAYIDTSGFGYQSDTIHFSAAGQISLGQAFAEKWVELQTVLSNATTVDADRPTLLGIRNKVRRRYERNISSNDDNSAQVDNFINDSLREIYNTLGDNAWFLRRVEPITLDGSFPGTMTLPRSVKRLLRVENLSNPGRAITWKGLAHRDNGRIQLTLHDYTGGPYECHFMARHVDLVKDSDLALIPGDYIELVVMLTCKRLAETAGNMSMIQYYAAETDRLYKYVKRDVLRYDRMRQGQMTTIDSFDSWRNGGSSGYLGGM